MSLPSFAPIREQLARTFNDLSPLMQRHLLLLVAFIAKDVTASLRPEEYPPDLIESVSGLFEEEIRAVRSTWAMLRAHYEDLGFTDEEAEDQVYGLFWKEYL
jgi:hypothetical protein